VNAKGRFLRLVLCLVSASLAGCVTAPRTPFTPLNQAAAAPPGFDHVRYAQDDPALRALLRQSIADAPGGTMNALAISGGGANGAYGAGLICGWSRTGQRPDFQIVTGVSTGALSAPFVFLGPGWDAQLRSAYLGNDIRHVLRKRGLFGLLTLGLYRRGPLKTLVEGYVTDELLREVAAENAKGRRLLVGTTNLDTEQLVIWDMGAIAAHGGPEARELFVQVLIASASVPGVFPPTMIRVEGAGRSFEEMHVDGETESAFFAVPQAILASKVLSVTPSGVHLYIVINGRLDSQLAVTSPSVLSVIGRTFDAENRASTRYLVISTVEFCQRTGCNLKVSTMPPTLTDDPLDFSAAHLQSLFDAGYALMSSGKAWRDGNP